MALLTAAEVRQHAETDLPDAALERLIDAEEAEITARYGPHGMLEAEAHTLGFGELHVWLTRRAAEVLAVRSRTWPGGALEAVDPVGYRLVHGGYALRRAWPYAWGREVEVDYVPADAGDARRVRALIDLVKISIEHKGVESIRAGDTTESIGDYAKRREAILAQLATGGRRMVA